MFDLAKKELAAANIVVLQQVRDRKGAPHIKLPRGCEKMQVYRYIGQARGIHTESKCTLYDNDFTVSISLGSVV